MRALLLGATGMLGRALQQAASPEIQLIATSHGKLDVTDPDAVLSALDELEPQVVVNASGYTAVDRAESDRAAAFAVNATAVEHLCLACHDRGIFFVHFSTDYVFDGDSSVPYREDDDPLPTNVYGESKLAGEEAILALGGTALLVRTQWLFGQGGISFPGTMLQRARRHERSRVVDDQFGRPTFTVDLAQASWQLVRQRQTGLLHVANSGDASWFDVAEYIYDRMQLSHLVSRCKTGEIPMRATRPLFSVLDTSRANHILGSPLPHWRDALERFISAELASIAIGAWN